MSVKELNKTLIISDCLDGQVLDVIPYSLYTKETITNMIIEIIDSYLIKNEHGVMIKFGFKT